MCFHRAEAVNSCTHEEGIHMRRSFLSQLSIGFLLLVGLSFALTHVRSTAFAQSPNPNSKCFYSGNSACSQCPLTPGANDQYCDNSYNPAGACGRFQASPPLSCTALNNIQCGNARLCVGDGYVFKPDGTTHAECTGVYNTCITGGG